MNERVLFSIEDLPCSLPDVFWIFLGVGLAFAAIAFFRVGRLESWPRRRTHRLFVASLVATGIALATIFVSVKTTCARRDEKLANGAVQVLRGKVDIIRPLEAGTIRQPLLLSVGGAMLSIRPAHRGYAYNPRRDNRDALEHGRCVEIEGTEGVILRITEVNCEGGRRR